jgi:hypothetical protein
MRVSILRKFVVFGVERIVGKSGKTGGEDGGTAGEEKHLEGTDR